MKRIALLIQYEGTLFSGWQKQNNAITVQECLEKALFKISNQKVNTYAAGRTDSGVHGSGQVVHYDIYCVIPGNSYAHVLNNVLPKTIIVLESVEVKDNWHACY